MYPQWHTINDRIYPNKSAWTVTKLILKETMSLIKFPFQIDSRGRTREATPSDHIKDMIEQVLFTTPGERPNRPTFGSGLHQLVFEPNSPELAATIEFLVKGALQQWLSEEIEVKEVSIRVEGSQLFIQISYLEQLSPMVKKAVFKRTI